MPATWAAPIFCKSCKALLRFTRFAEISMSNHGHQLCQWPMSSRRRAGCSMLSTISAPWISIPAPRDSRRSSRGTRMFRQAKRAMECFTSIRAALRHAAFGCRSRWVGYVFVKARSAPKSFAWRDRSSPPCRNHLGHLLRYTTYLHGKMSSYGSNRDAETVLERESGRRLCTLRSGHGVLKSRANGPCPGGILQAGCNQPGLRSRLPDGGTDAGRTQPLRRGAPVVRQRHRGRTADRQHQGRKRDGGNARGTLTKGARKRVRGPRRTEYRGPARSQSFQPRSLSLLMEATNAARSLLVLSGRASGRPAALRAIVSAIVRHGSCSWLSCSAVGRHWTSGVTPRFSSCSPSGNTTRTTEI